MHDEKSTLPSSLPPTMLSAQAVESDAVARRDDTLDVHSSFFRKLKLGRDDAVERGIKDVPVRRRVVEIAWVSCCDCVGKS